MDSLGPWGPSLWALVAGRGLAVGTGQSAYKEPPKHLPFDSRAQAVGGSGFLLTSARAIMLELVTVYSFFAISTLPVDIRERSPLSQGIPTPLCSPDLHPGPLS